MLRACATSLMPTRQFSSTIFSTFSMLSSLTEVDGQLAWGKSSTTSRPALNALCHSITCVLDRVDSQKHFCNLFYDSVAVIPLETQNFKQTRCSFFFHSKNRQTNFSRRKPMAVKHTLMDVSCSNFTRLSKEKPRKKTFYRFGLRARFNWTSPGQIWSDGRTIQELRIQELTEQSSRKFIELFRIKCGTCNHIF